MRRHTEGDALPCISETLRRLMALDPENELSAQELAEIILEDYGLITKVLQTVNTFYYNRLGQEITTVTQAVILLGFNTIRKVALEMSVIDMLPEKENRAAARLLVEAFISAGLAQEAAEQIGADAEEMFLEALLQLLSRIVTAVKEPEFYEDITELEKEASPKEKKKIDNIWRKANVRLAEKLNLSGSISRYMGGAPSAEKAPERTGALIVLSKKIAELTVSMDLQQIGRFVDHFKELSGISDEHMQKALNRAVVDTRARSPIFKTVLADVSHMVPSADDSISGLQDSYAGPEETGRCAAADAAGGEGLFLDLLNQTMHAVLLGEMPLNQLYLLAAETIQRGVPIERVLLCLLSPDRKRLVVRYCLGRRVQQMKANFIVRFPVFGHPVGTAFRKGGEAVGMWGQIPISGSSAEKDLAQKSVCVSPLIVSGHPIGCFILDRNSVGAEFDKIDIGRIAAIRRLVLLGTVRRTG